MDFLSKHIKTPEQIEKMRRAGLVVWQAHQAAAELVKPGVTTRAVDAAVEACIRANKAKPLFKGVPGTVPFPAATCISVNEEIVHGIPGDRVLREGDIVSIDIGARLNGWCGDAAVTRPVGQIDAKKRKLLEVTEEVLRIAIHLVQVKRKWSEVAREMARYAEAQGFSVIEELVGHSIGQSLWEGLHVPNMSSRKFERYGDFDLEPGVVIAVEPMINAGSRHIRQMPDHWTISTQDGQPSAHFEHTIALTEAAPIILTSGPNGEGWAGG